MDDHLDSFDNLDEALTSIHDMTRLLTFGGSKFISNNRIILKILSRESLSSKVVNLDLGC